MSHLTPVPDDIGDDDDELEKEERFMAIRAVPEAAARLLELKEEIADLQAEVLFCENWIDMHVKESEVVQIGEKSYKTTPVRGTQTNVDTKKMRRLAPDLYKRVIKVEEVEKVDSDALAKEIEKGTIPLGMLRQFITQKPKKTSIRLTEARAHDEEEED